MTIGEKLKKIRVNMKLTQVEISKTLDITQRTYSQYENDNTQPTFDTLKKICVNFNINPTWLFFEQGNMYNNQIIVDNSNNIDKETLKNAIELIEVSLNQEKIKPDQKAEKIITMIDYLNMKKKTSPS